MDTDYQQEGMMISLKLIILLSAQKGTGSPSSSGTLKIWISPSKKWRQATMFDPFPSGTIIKC